MKFRISLLATSILASGLTSGAALAQANDEIGQAEEESAVLGTVTVTTERREQNIQDVAAIVKSVTGEELSRLGTNQFTDLSNQIPQLSIGNREGNVEVFIRGIGDDNNTELSEPRTAILLDNVYISRPRGLGSFFFDVERVEVNIGPQGTIRGRNAVGGSLNVVSKRPELGRVGGFADVSFANFDQREFSGAINIPVGDKLAFRAAGYSLQHDPFIEGVGPLNIESTQDQDDWSARFSALWEPNEKFSALIVADYSEQDGNGFGGIDFDTAGVAGIDIEDLDDLPLDGRGRLNQGGQAFQDTTIWGVRTVLNYQVSEALNLEYLGAFRSVDFQSVGPGGQGFFGTNPILSEPQAAQDDFFDNFALTSFDQISQSQVHEIRASGTIDKLTYNTGFFYFDETGNSFFNTTADNGIVFAGVEFAIPDVNRENFAFYGDVTYEVTDKFRLSGGIRYTDEEINRTGIGATFVPLFINGPAFDQPFRFGTDGIQFAGNSRTGFSIADFDLDGDGALTGPQEFVNFFFDGVSNFGANDTIDDALLAALEDGTLVPNSTITDQVGEFQDDYIDWRVKAEYDITPNNLVYATIATGTNSGGFNDTFPGPDGVAISPTFEREELINYEIGTKNQFEFFDGYVSTINLTGFFLDYDDQQFTTLAAIAGADSILGDGGLQSLRQNIGDSRILGFDFDASQNLPYGLTARLNVQFLDTEFRNQSLPFLSDTRFNDFANDPLTTVEFRPEGNELPRASDWSGVFTLSQALDTDVGRFDWIASLGFRSSYFLTIFNGDGSLPDPELLGNPDPAQLALSGIELSPDQLAAIEADGGPLAPNAGAEGLVTGAGTLSGRVAGTVRIDLGAGWEPNDNIRVEVFGKNLTDQTVSQSGLIAQGLNLRFLNAPRQYGIRLRYKF